MRESAHADFGDVGVRAVRRAGKKSSYRRRVHIEDEANVVVGWISASS